MPLDSICKGFFFCHIILSSHQCAAHQGHLGSWGNHAVVHRLIGAQGKHKHKF